MGAVHGVENRFGGSPALTSLGDGGAAIAVDSSGNAYVTDTALDMLHRPRRVVRSANLRAVKLKGLEITNLLGHYVVTPYTS